MSKQNQPKEPKQVVSGWHDFAELEYTRKLEERALYPFSTINFMTGGMELGELTIIAGETGAGKTTFMTQVVNEVIKFDKMACMYGESTLAKQVQNTYRSMTPYTKEGGGTNYEYKVYERDGKSTNIGAYFVNQEWEEKIKEKTKGKLYYYDTTKGMTMDDIVGQIDIAVKRGGIRYFLIDNMTQVETITNDEVKELKDSVERLRRYCIDNKVSIVLLAHFRKAQEMNLIRRNLQEIMGSSASGQKGATVMNIIRLDGVDRNGKPYKNLNAIGTANGWNFDDADALVEVLKTRHNKLGFVPLKFYKATNTYKELPNSNRNHDSGEKEQFEKKPTLHAKPSETQSSFFGNEADGGMTPVDDDDLPF